MADNTDQPIYNQEFYAAIIRERRKLGSAGYVDIDQMMAITGREYSQPVFQNETVENKRAEPVKPV